jgi:uncharacterized protein YjdB
MEKTQILYTRLFILVLSAVASLTSCAETEPQAVAVEFVTLNSSEIELIEGERYTLTAKVSPSNADNKQVLWTSSNSSIATVVDGIVTALKAGTTTIIATTDDGAKTATCKVTVLPTPVGGISIDKSSIELFEGDIDILTATVTPENAGNKNLTWTSSNTNIATVEDGVVTAIKAGTATITAKTEDGGKTATCKITVLPIPVGGITLNMTSVEIFEGETAILTATVTPENASNKKVRWNSSDSSVAIVENGVITAIKVGVSIITVTTEDGAKTAACQLSVRSRAVESISLRQESLKMKKGETTTLDVIITPENATNKNVIWSSSNEAVASINNGKITALTSGQTTITVKTEDGGLTATCEITVIVPVKGISMDTDELNIKLGSTTTISAVVHPVDATNPSIVWSISDTAVITVNGDSITAIGIGTVTLTATTVDGGLSVSRTVRVVPENITPGGPNMDVIEEEF